MPSPLHSYKVFIAAAPGLAAEERVLHDTINAFNQEQAIARGMHLLPVGAAVRAPADVDTAALTDLRECDFFLLLLADRWDEADSADRAAGAHAQFDQAAEALHDADRPMRQLAIFFKPPAPDALAAMDADLRRVMAFRHEVEADAEHACFTFDSLDNLRGDVRRCLGLWLRDHQENIDRKAEARRAREEAADGSSDSTFTYATAASATDEAPALVRGELIAEGKRLADAGRADAAEACFTLAIARADDPSAFIEYGKFLRRVGRLSQAQDMFEKALSFAQQRGDLEVVGAACLCLGMLLQLKGDLPGAQQMFSRALDVSKQRGDDRARSQAFANLGLVHKARGDLVQAELLIRRALALEEKLGRLHGMANQYCNLGLISRRLGDLTRADDMLRRALEIDQKLGRLEAVANGYANIGLILKAAGDLDGAEDCFHRAMTINESLGRLEGLAGDYGNLGLIHQKRGQLDEAEKMHLTSLSIEEQLGRTEGMARSHYSLGVIATSRLDAAAAREHWHTARKLFTQVGMPREVRLMEKMLR